MAELSFSKADKALITEQWQQLFTSMEVYKKLWIGNILGPLFVGVHLQIDADLKRYHPILHISSIIESTEYLSIGLHMNDGLDYVSVLSEPEKYLSIAKKMRSLAIIPLEGDVGVDLVINALMKYCRKVKKSRKLFGRGELERFEAVKLLMTAAYWSENERHIDRVTKFSLKELSSFNKNWYLREYAAPQALLQSIEEKCSDLQVSYQRCIQSLDLTKLPHRELII